MSRQLNQVTVSLDKSASLALGKYWSRKSLKINCLKDQPD